MKEEMKKILRQQQEYEYIKNCPSLLHLPKNHFAGSATAAAVFPYIKKATQSKKQQKRKNQIAKVIFYLFFFYYILCFIFFYTPILLYPLTLIE